MFDELAPASESGPKSDEMILQSGPAINTIVLFENVTLQISAQDLALNNPNVHEYAERIVTASIKWKNRKCQ